MKCTKTKKTKTKNILETVYKEQRENSDKTQVRDFNKV